MASPSSGMDALLDALEALEGLLNENALQPLHQYAETALAHWSRVAEGKEQLLPRLTADGYIPNSFHFGLERIPAHRIEAVPAREEPPPFAERLAVRLTALHVRLERYFAQSGYRSSAEQCDQAMLACARLSRFLAGVCLEDEMARERLAAAATAPAASPAAWPDAGEEAPPDTAPDMAPARLPSRASADAGSPEPAAVGCADGAALPPAPPCASPEARVDAEGVERHLGETRGAMFLWEPYLNEVVVAWEQNGLTAFDDALETVRGLLALAPDVRQARRYPGGYPLRPLGQRRIKVTVMEPQVRPLRGKSMFAVRFAQLVRRLEEGPPLADAPAAALAADVRQFLEMARQNHYMLAGAPSFWSVSRQGLPLIRGRPASHPALLDPMDFFKKALLFHNRTYTVDGGGADAMYLQVRQLERYHRFQLGSGARPLKGLIDECLRGWEENRWSAFTEGLLRIGEALRAQARTGETPSA